MITRLKRTMTMRTKSLNRNLLQNLLPLLCLYHQKSQSQLYRNVLIPLLRKVRKMKSQTNNHGAHTAVSSLAHL